MDGADQSLALTRLPPCCQLQHHSDVTTGCEGEKRLRSRKGHVRELQNCIAKEHSHVYPEIPTAVQVLLSHAVVALAFVWVTVMIIIVCGVGFYYLLFSLNVKLTVKLALVRQQAWCSFYLS